MIGNDEEGDYTLDINPVQLEDDAKFQCQVGAAPGDVLPIRSRDATLTVYVPPEPPVVINGDLYRTIENRDIELECVSRGGKPAAEITWIDGSGTVITDAESSTEKVENTKLETRISKLKFAAKKEHHNTTITCQAQNSADRQPNSASIKLLVEYAPDVKITVDHEPLFEGEDTIFKCEAHANPRHMTYRWQIDTESVPGNHGTELRLAKLSSGHNDKIVKCEVNNQVGKSEATMVLDVNFAPEFVTKPEDVSGERGQNVSLRCVVKGNPEPTYTWFKNGDFQMVRGHKSSLTVTISEMTIGKYICRASVRGFEEITASAEIMMKGPPRILTKAPEHYGSKGDTLRLTCDAFAIPKPMVIRWSQMGFPIDLHSSHYAVVEDSRKDGLRSTLIIHNSMDSDFTDYNCTVENSHGADSFIITLKKQKSLSLIIILPAVIGGIILTMFAIIVTVMCRRMSSFPPIKSSSSSEKTYASSTVTSASSKPSSMGGLTHTNGATSSSSSAMLNTTATSEASSGGGGGALLHPPHHKVANNGGLSVAFSEAMADWEQDSLEGSVNNHPAVHQPRIVNGLGDYAMDGGFYPDSHSGGYHVQANPAFPASSSGGFLPHHQDQPPPPPMHHMDNANGAGNDLLNSFRGLNVSDPRYAAKYGNPYLRMPATSSPQTTRTVNFASSVGRPYATLSSRSPVTSSSVAAVRNGQNYTGTMLGNGSLKKKNGASNPQSQYILSPDNDVKAAGALATHV